MHEIVKKLKNTVIISCQATRGEPIYEDGCLTSIIKSVIRGGAGGLRLAGAADIKKTRSFSDIPIIGLTKPEIMPGNWLDTVYITSTYDDAKKISEAGADIIAIDGTSRKRPKESLEELVKKIKQNLNKPIMADISTLEEGAKCTTLGVDVISTTLSGYTSYTQDRNNGDPDFKLLAKLVNTYDIPIILEGRIWTPEQAKKAFRLGAHAVVIGTAITRPEAITQRFISCTK